MTVPFTIHIDSNRTWGGGQEQSLGLALALAERGERVHFIAQSGSELAARLKRTGLSFDSMPLRGIVGAAHSVSLHRLFRRMRPEVLHVHDSAAQTPAILAAARMGDARPRIVVTRRTDLPIRRPARAVWDARFCDRVICISEAVRRRLLDVGIPAERTVVIPDFVDCQRFDPALLPSEARARPTVVTVGRLSPEKGHAALLRAMTIIVRSCPEARLVIAGQGGQRSALERQVEAMGISRAVEFLGFMPDVRDVLAAADVFVMPSISEGLGVAALEAMAMGRPVVASNVGGLPESVADGETGLIVPAGDAGALAEAVVGLFGDLERARAMGRAGRERALAYFDRGPVVNRILALYYEALSET